MFEGAVGTGMAAVRDEREKQIYADKLGFETKVRDAESRFKIALDAIPVGDGVDIESETAEILQREYGTLRDYLNEPGNVRHKQAMRDFEARLAEAEANAKRGIGEYTASYERRRSVGRGERMVEVGIRTGDESLIEKGIFAQHEAGKFDQATSQTVYEKSVFQMKEGADKALMVEAENLLGEGDYDGFRARIDSLNLPTLEEKKKIKREMSATHSFNAANLFLAELETVSEIRDFRKDPEKFTGVKGMDDNRRKKILYDAKKAEQRILREQEANAGTLLKLASKGEFDPGQFDAMAKRDDAKGLPGEQVDLLRDKVTKALDAYEKGEARKVIFAVAAKDEKYKALNESLSARLLDPAGFDLKDTLEEIEGSKLGDVVKVDLMSRAFGIAASQYSEMSPEPEPRFSMWEVLPFVAFYKETFGKGELAQGEIDSLERTYSTFKESVEVLGVWDGLTDDLNDVQKAVNKFYRKEDPTPEEITAFEEKTLRPLRDKILRKKILSQ